MDRINWPAAIRIWKRWNEEGFPTDSARALLKEIGLPEIDIESMLSPNAKFQGNFGSFTGPRYFANVESGDLYIVNWMQNVPTLWSWVEISREAYNIWSGK